MTPMMVLTPSFADDHAGVISRRRCWRARGSPTSAWCGACTGCPGSRLSRRGALNQSTKAKTKRISADPRSIYVFIHSLVKPVGSLNQRQTKHTSEERHEALVDLQRDPTDGPQVVRQDREAAFRAVANKHAFLSQRCLAKS